MKSLKIKPLIIALTIILIVSSVLTGSAYAEGGQTHRGGFIDLLSNGLSRIVTLNNTAQFKNAKSGFGYSEKPHFTLEIPTKNKDKVGKSAKGKWTNKNEKISAEITYKADGEKIPAIIQKTDQGEFEVKVDDGSKAEFKRGEYSLEVSAKESFIYTRDLTQDFSWGVLAINTNKSIYKPGETAELAMGVLDEDGDTVCNAKITLIIADPDHNEKTLTSADKTIKNNPLCGNTPDPVPDYAASYKVGKPGRYFMHITAENKNGKHSLTDYFEVRENIPFDIERINFPTRIYPAAAYPVKLKIHAYEDYHGKVVDYALASMKITEISDGGSSPNTLKGLKMMDVSEEVKKSDEDTYRKIKNQSELLYARPSGASVDKTPMPITWDVTWQKGKDYELSYTINFPGVSPEFYLLGPAKIGDFEEVRQWQVASDAIRCWDGGGADNLWQTVGNWSGNSRPGSGDRVVFDNTFAAVVCAGATDATPNKDSSLTPTFAGTVQRVDILNYTGTITQTQTLTLNTGGVNIGFVQSAAGSTWTGSGAVNITLTASTGDFVISNGTFTAPSGTITVPNNFTYSGGTFTANSGTVALAAPDNNNNTYTGDTTFNNLTVSSDECCNGSTSTIASGTELIVTGTLTITGIDNGDNRQALLGSGRIEARGNISIVDRGMGIQQSGQTPATILVNGTGDQTITGGTSLPDDYFYRLPSLTINKQSGTLTYVNTITITGSYAYTSGALITTGSTIVQNVIDGYSATMTGLGPLNNLTISFLNCCNGSDITVPAGLTADGNFALLGIDGNGATVNGGPIIVKGNFTVTMDDVSTGFDGNASFTLAGSQNQTVTQSITTGDMPTGTFTVAKQGGTVTQATAFTLGNSGQDMTITSGVWNTSSFGLTVNDTFTVNGQFDQGSGNFVTGSSGEVVVGATGIWMNNSTGDITIGASGSGFSNSGYVRLDGGGASEAGESTNDIAIATTTATTARTWSGAGTYNLIDLTVRDAGGSLTCYSCTNTSNNAWTFNSSMPAYSNRKTTSVTGGMRITGNTTIKSN